jgi:hypothetical protein
MAGNVFCGAGGPAKDDMTGALGRPTDASGSDHHRGGVA